MARSRDETHMRLARLLPLRSVNWLRTSCEADHIIKSAEVVMASVALTNTGRQKNPWRAAIWGCSGALLLLPLNAVQFTDEVQWTISDFVVFGTTL